MGNKNLFGILCLTKSKSKTWMCLYVSLISLIIQMVIFVCLVNYIDQPPDIRLSFKTTEYDDFEYSYDDIKTVLLYGSNVGLYFIAFEPTYLKNGRYRLGNLHRVKDISSLIMRKPRAVDFVLGIDRSIKVDKLNEFLQLLIGQDFVPVTFYNHQPVQHLSELMNIQTSIFLQRRTTLQIVLLYTREDNTWWFGDIQSDSLYKPKLASLNLTLDQVNIMRHEGAIERFDLVPSTLEEESHLLFPQDIDSFSLNLNGSKFIECNVTRSALYRSQFGLDNRVEAVRFRHKVWKMLSRVKIVLDSLKIPFWLSSGTVLGYFRECDIIAHSKDLDLGIFASDYSDQIVTELQNRGFRLKISLGFPNDSFELSFKDSSGIKLDIFFFYKEDGYYWNGGTQVKSGKKFKYIFPKFTLCWTLFRDLRLRVPCETEAYVRANYGSDWFTPVKSWDWKSSPSNVHTNGVWRPEQLPSAIKLYL